jgi:hypothetical protein
MVFFHKTPALWNKTKNLGTPPSVDTLAKLKQKLSKTELSEEMKEFLNTDVYFQMCKRICLEMGVKEFHIVHGFMEEEKRNWTVGSERGWSQIDRNTTYWTLTSPNDLLGFIDSEIIFTRGNYPNLHNWLNKHSTQSQQQFWLHYPATSLRYPHLHVFEKSVKAAEVNISRVQDLVAGLNIEHQRKSTGEAASTEIEELIRYFQTIREQPIGGPYSLVLSDDKTNVETLKKVFPTSSIQTFSKPAVSSIPGNIHKRTYDLIFCGTTLQTTKNHQCFIQLMKHIDIYVDFNLKVVIVGNEKDSPIFNSLFNYPFSNITLFDEGEVSREQLQHLFSRSKTCIVTSGRDANPRVIQESLIHGARVLVVDTLSDGMDFISSNPLLGSVLESEPEFWKYTRNGNLEFKPTMRLASRIVEEIKKSDYPDLVSKVSRKKLSIDESVKSLVKTIQSFL